MAKNFKDLVAKMSPESQARIRQKTAQLNSEMALDELRAARELTQARLADLLEIDQSSVSKLERRTDMYVSTLRDFIAAMGGRLEIRAIFPDGVVTISQFGDGPRALPGEGA